MGGAAELSERPDLTEPLPRVTPVPGAKAPMSGAASRQARRASPYRIYRRRRRRRRLAALFVTLAVLTGALEVADVVTRHVTEDALARPPSPAWAERSSSNLWPKSR